MGYVKKVEDGEEDNGSVKIGARMAKHQIAFFPGDAVSDVYSKYGVSIEYHLLQFEEFAVDWSGMTLHFLTHTVQIEGENLKGLLDQVKSHILDSIEVARPVDPLHAAAGRVGERPRFKVSRITVEAAESS